jgi:hypothetical protein
MAFLTLLSFKFHLLQLPPGINSSMKGLRTALEINGAGEQALWILLETACII